MIKSFIDKDASLDVKLYKSLCDNLFNDDYNAADIGIYRASRSIIPKLKAHGVPTDNRAMIIDQCFNVFINAKEYVETVKDELFKDEQSDLLVDLIHDLINSMHITIDHKKKHIKVDCSTSNFTNVYEAWKLRNRGVKS